MARRSSKDTGARPFTIFKRSSAGTYYIKFNRQQYSTGIAAHEKNLPLVERKAWELVREWEEGREHRKRPRITIQEAFDRFKRDYGCMRSKRTQQHYENSFTACIVSPQDMLTRENIIANIRNARTLHHGITVNGWNSYRTSITTIVRFWEREQLLYDRLDVRSLFAAKRPVPVKVWTQEEIDRIIDYFTQRDPEYAVFLRILAITGMRVHELMELKWSDVTDDAIRLVSKDGRRNESIPMFSGLRDLLHLIPRDRTTVFRWKESNVSRLRHRLHDACIDLEIDDEGRSFHTFRKTFISRMASEGVDVRLAAAIARCDISVMMKHYTLLQTTKKTETLEQIGLSISPILSPNCTEFMPTKGGRMTKRPKRIKP